MQHAARAARGAVQQLAPGVVPQLGVRPQAVAHRLQGRMHKRMWPGLYPHYVDMHPSKSKGYASTGCTVPSAQPNSTTSFIG